MSEEGAAAGLGGVLESSLYHEPGEAAAVERFYTEDLGLRVVSRWPGGVRAACRSRRAAALDRSVLAEREADLGMGRAAPVTSAGRARASTRAGGRASGAPGSRSHEHEEGRPALPLSAIRRGTCSRSRAATCGPSTIRIGR